MPYLKKIKRKMVMIKNKDTKSIVIREYKSVDKTDFRDLNVAWISQYFEMEDADYQALDFPEQYILEQGGHIVVASFEERVIGVCALLKRDSLEYPYELAKMAVSPQARGQGVGYLLGEAIVQKAKELGADKLYLESNTQLEPAINLYKKLGFMKVEGYTTPYKRCNIQMEKIL